MTRECDGIEEALRPEASRLAIVFFHVNNEADHPLFTMQPKSDYRPIIRLAVEAARRHHPDALIAMFSDYETAFEQDLDMTVIRMMLQRKQIMYERTRCQWLFAERWREQSIHIDTDVIMNAPFNALMKKGFDVGVTFRYEGQGMHINGGMLLGADSAKFSTFMRHMTNQYLAIAEAAKAWSDFDLRDFRGGQMALAQMCHSKGIGTYATKHWGNLAIWDSELVCRPYRPAEHRTPPFPYAWHLKGPLKLYARNFMNPDVRGFGARGAM